ncbi:MAG: helix-turn-helix transcriptional regulator [Clostridia bacterium]|nr:helix-turn-helix transcriptional regulator [Clostridia bacterium]
MEKNLHSNDLQEEQHVSEVDNLKVTIGKNICEYRKLANLSQIEFAEKLNYSDKAISKWERGESLPDIIVLKQIADLFGITVNDLLGQSTQKKKRSLSFKKLLKNKILVMLLSVGLVWLVATVLFVFLIMFNALTDYAWLAFIYAMPISFILCMIFTGRWKLKIPLMVFESLFVWTLALSICLTINYSNIWLLLIIGFPLQALIVFWFFYQKQKNANK